MQGVFCFIKCLIFEWLPEVDVKPSVGLLMKLARAGPIKVVRGSRRRNKSSALHAEKKKRRGKIKKVVPVSKKA